MMMSIAVDLSPIVIDEIRIYGGWRLVPKKGTLVVPVRNSLSRLFLEAGIPPFFWEFSEARSEARGVLRKKVLLEVKNLWLKYARADDLTLTDEERKQKRWLLQMLVEECAPAH